MRWQGPGAGGVALTMVVAALGVLSCRSGPQGVPDVPQVGRALEKEQPHVRRDVWLEEGRGPWRGDVAASWLGIGEECRDGCQLVLGDKDYVLMLGPRRADAGASKLLILLQDDSADLLDRSHAARLLALLRLKDAEEPLLKLLESEDLYARNAAIVALGDLRSARAVGRLLEEVEREGETLFESFVIVPVEQPKGVGAVGTAGFGDSLLDNRWYAAEALGKIGDPRAVPALIGLLQGSATSAPSAAAADALGKIGDRRALDALQNATGRASDHGVQEWARRGIVQIETKGRSVGELVADLKSDNKYVRYYAVCALRQRGDVGCVPALEGLLSDREVIRRDVLTPIVIETIGSAAADAIAVIRARGAYVSESADAR